MNRKDITVGIPFYSETSLNEFSSSLDSILNQTIQPSMIHLIQDGEINSKLDKMVKKYLLLNDNIKHIKLKKTNLPSALNQSIKLTKTKYYARMDSDDIAMVNRLEIQYYFLERNDNIDILGSWAVEFNKDISNPRNFIRKMPEKYSDIINFYHYRNPLIHPTVMFRMSFFETVGYYNEDNNYCEDLELWGRSIKCKVGIYNIQEPLLYYNMKGVYKRRTSLAAIRSQIMARCVLPADTIKYKLLKFLAICLRFMPIRIIKYIYKKTR